MLNPKTKTWLSLTHGFLYYEFFAYCHVFFVFMTPFSFNVESTAIN